VVVGLAVIAGVVIVARLNSDDRVVSGASPTTSSSAHPTDESTAGTSASPVQGASSTAAGSDPASFAGQALPAAGPGVTQPGILMLVSPAADGSFDVLELARLASPASVFTLRPAPVDRAGRQFASASGAATEVQVSAGDQQVVTGATIAAGVELPVPEGDQFELRYRLSGVTVQRTPAPAGRALAAIGPLTGGVDGDLPVLFVVSGGTVLGLSCPLLPFSEQACGSRVPPALSVQRELPWRLALTTVQFDVPEA
jgi:hypothetical protein